MKRPRRRSRTVPDSVSADQIQHYVQCLEEEHQEAWLTELTTPAPHWVYLIGLHLRLVELEQLETAVEEFL